MDADERGRLAQRMPRPHQPQGLQAGAYLRILFAPVRLAQRRGLVLPLDD
jgi:hypothetical protein